MNIKIAIADDHALIADGIQNMLRYSTEIEVVGTYLNGRELLAGISIIQPDVLLLDISMPEQTGDELARIIRRDFPDIRIIALTNLDNIYHIKSMMQEGVSGYLLKNVKRNMLIDAIKAVYTGEYFFDETVKLRIAEEKHSIKRQAGC